MAPKIIKLTGNKIHCKTIQNHFNLPNLRGFGGRRIIEMIAEDIIPNIAKSITILVINGRLKDKILRLKTEPPATIGSQPKRKIMRALVAAE